MQDPAPQPSHVAYRIAQAASAHARGWLLTPLRGKLPILHGWTDQPAPSTEQVAIWARQGNLGLRTGRASGIYVIDEDTGAGGDVTPLNLPPCPTVKTGRGRHFYFRASAFPMGNTASKLGPHIDTRGDGGQVVFPGSVHPTTGTVYRWEPGLSPEDLPPPELPANVVAALAPKRSAFQPSQVQGSKYAQKALTEELRRVQQAPEGARNETLNRAAFALGQLVAGKQLLESEVRAALEGAALAAGLPAHEISRTIDSGLQAGLAEPRAPRGRPPRLTERAQAPLQEQPSPEAAPAKPEVLIPGAHTDGDGEYHEVGDHAFVARILTELPGGAIYRRGGVVGELSGEPGGVTFRGMTNPRLRAIIDTHVRLYRWHTTSRKNATPEEFFVPCNSDLAELTAGTAGGSPLVRDLALLCSYPAVSAEFRPLEPGWNPQSRSYYDEPETLRDLQPLADPVRIRCVLEDLVVDFPFADVASQHNFFGLLLTPLLRPALDGNVPMHLISSPIERTGKTKLAEEVLGGIIIGAPTPAMQFSGYDEERDKRITSLLLSGASLLHLDNLRAFLDSAALASLLTSSTYMGRRLGVSELLPLSNTLTVVATGNNVRMSGELAKRTVPIVLQPASDHPEDREDFRHPDLRAYVRSVRRDVLSALLGAIALWRQAGCPLAGSPMGGFERWSSVVGGILAAVGLTQFRGNVKAWVKESNTEGDELQALVEGWVTLGDPSEERRAISIFRVAEELNLFQQKIRGNSENSRLASFSKVVLHRYINTPVSGWMIRAKGSASSRFWYLSAL